MSARFRWREKVAFLAEIIWVLLPFAIIVVSCSYGIWNAKCN